VVGRLWPTAAPQKSRRHDGAAVGHKRPTTSFRKFDRKADLHAMESTRVVLELPKFDTGQFEDCAFHMDGGDATLVIRIAEIGDFSISFHRVRWHRFTQLLSCDTSWIHQAYLRLIEVRPGELIDSLLKPYTGAKAAPRPFRELHHFMIFLDEVGCHEVVAESAEGSLRPPR